MTFTEYQKSTALQEKEQKDQIKKEKEAFEKKLAELKEQHRKQLLEHNKQVMESISEKKADNIYIVNFSSWEFGVSVLSNIQKSL